MPLIHSECRQTEEYSCTVHWKKGKYLDTFFFICLCTILWTCPPHFSADCMYLMSLKQFDTTENVDNQDHINITFNKIGQRTQILFLGTSRIILCRIKYVVSPTIARDQKKDQEHVYKGYPLASYSPIILVTRCATKSRCFTLADNCSHEAAAPGHCASAVQLPGHYVCGECCQRADREFPGCWSFKHWC